MAFVLGIVKKRKSGKEFKDFDESDWKEIAGDTGIGTLKGGIRGSSIYLLSNYTVTPAAVASAIVTASFGVAEQAFMFRKGELDELTFLENSELLCLDASVSALSSLAGQVIIPVPVLGAVVGNAVGTMLHQITMDYLKDKEQALVEEYLHEISSLRDELDVRYSDFLKQLMENMKVFMGILDRAFAPDIRVAFSGSIDLARQMGVPEEEILDSKEKIVSYFMD